MRNVLLSAGLIWLGWRARRCFTRLRRRRFAARYDVIARSGRVENSQENEAPVTLLSFVAPVDAPPQSFGFSCGCE